MNEPYVDRLAIEEVITTFKKYASKMVEKLKESEAADPKKKKPKLLGVTDEESKHWHSAGFAPDEKMTLQMSFKFPPRNTTTYINRYKSFPHPFHDLADSTICLIVIDRAHKPLADRDLDLRLTREFYQKRLLDAGISEDLIKHRISILPMRELLTEYRLPQMKRRLATAYDIFLADHRLVKNRFKLLPGFLGQKFWIEKKKFPLGIRMDRKGQTLRESFDKALATCAFYVTGHGPDTSVQFGLFCQPEKHLANNLEFLISKIQGTYGEMVQLLKVKTSKSLAIPFYADLRQPLLSLLELVPRSKRLDSGKVIDEHPFSQNAQLVVYPTGRLAIRKKRPHRQHRLRNRLANGLTDANAVAINGKAPVPEETNESKTIKTVEPIQKELDIEKKKTKKRKV